MSTESYEGFDPFWRRFFGRGIDAGVQAEKILAGVSMLNLQRVTEPVDLSLCLRMPRLREILGPSAPIDIAGKEALAALPTLRELVITDGAFSASDLPLISRAPNLAALHINGMTLTPEALHALNGAPKLKKLTLHNVRGIGASGLAGLTAITQLRLSEMDGELGELARMPKLRSLDLGHGRIALADLDFLAAPRLTAFTADDRAADESGLAHLAKLTGLEDFSYPTSDFTHLIGCTKLRTLRVDGSRPLDFAVIAHLPITGISVYLAPDQETAEAIIARAKATWPALRSTGYRQDWARPA